MLSRSAAPGHALAVLVSGVMLVSVSACGGSDVTSESATSSTATGPTPEAWAAAICPKFKAALQAPTAYSKVDGNADPETIKKGWQDAAEEIITTYDAFLDVLDEPTPQVEKAPEVVAALKDTFSQVRTRSVAIRDTAAGLDTSDSDAFAAGAQKVVKSLEAAQADLNKLDEIDRIDPDNKVGGVLKKNPDCGSFAS
ncbi:MAG: hypothetical protein ACRC35_03755 [Angustibacter sp.]